MRDTSFLTALAVDGNLDALPSVWRRSVLEIVCDAPEGFDAGPSLPGRLRGAFGHALLDRRNDADFARALTLFFGDIGLWRPRSAIPKPFVIAFGATGSTLSIRLTLFGFADRWREAAFDAFVEALSRGVSVGPAKGARRAPLTPLSVEWTRVESVSVPPAGLATRLSFQTPLRLGPSGALGARYCDLVVSLAERAAGMALWQGMRIEPDLGSWRDLAQSIRFDDSALTPFRWDRRSSAQGGRTIPMMGYLGSLDIIRPPPALMPLLALGETMHVGGGAALGLGRFVLL